MKEFKKITVEGLLVYGQGNTMINQKYKADFIIPEMSEGHARGLIQNKLIAGHLRDTVEFYKRWRTCSVTNMQDATEEEVKGIFIDPKTANKLSINQLCQLAVNLNLDVDPSKIPSLEEARWRVVDAIAALDSSSNEVESEEVEESEEFEEFEESEPETIDDEFSPEPEKVTKKPRTQRKTKKKTTSGRK